MILGALASVIWLAHLLGFILSPCMLDVCVIPIGPYALILGIMGLFRPGSKKKALAGLALSALSVVLLFIWSQQRLISPVTLARTESTKLRLSEISSALRAFHTDLGRYPSTAEGINALIHAPTTPMDQWHGPYIIVTEFNANSLENWGKDAWGNPIIYKFPGTTHPDTFDLFSAGRDGQPNTTDDITP
jgi:general secretion pathway protein G